MLKSEERLEDLQEMRTIGYIARGSSWEVLTSFTELGIQCGGHKSLFLSMLELSVPP